MMKCAARFEIAKGSLLLIKAISKLSIVKRKGPEQRRNRSAGCHEDFVCGVGIQVRQQ